MSRYRKVITNEIELPEISGTKFLIYPTIEAKMELLEHVKASQMFEEFDEEKEDGKKITKRIRGKFFNVNAVAKTCTKLVFEGCWNHDQNGNRTSKKEDEAETTENDILLLMLDSDVMNVYLECLLALDIVDKNKAKEIKESQKKAEKN